MNSTDSIGLPLLLDAAALLSLDKYVCLSTTVATAICTQGWASFKIDGLSHRLHPGQLTLVRHGQCVSDICVSDDFIGFALAAPLQLLSPSLWSLSQVLNCFIFYRNRPVINLSESNISTLLTLHKILCKKMENLTVVPEIPFSKRMVETLVLAIFYEVLNAYSSGMNQSAQGSTGRIDQLFYDFIRLVERNFRTERRVMYYASLLNITPKHLCALSKELTGRSPARWISSYVILEAKRMLSSTDMTIQQISLELAFPNQSVFGRFFKIHTGTTPKEYRLMKKKAAPISVE